jgi:monofunctional biosynthetic peptidoglycan transglycosylase
MKHAWAGVKERVAGALRPARGALQRLKPQLPGWLPRALPFAAGATALGGLWPPATGLSRYLRVALSVLRLTLRAAAWTAAALAVVVLALVVAYRWIDPPISALMLGQSIAGTSIERRWVPIERISPHLIKAVVVSEDGRFCGHSGVDLGALQDAIAHDRGGSTITMQVVKNLFLWPSRSYVRKVIEIALAYVVDGFWPKRRILEIYLNIAEWGDGVFGAEAAARAHFGKSAARLTPEEAALMTVALPNPLERTPGLPSNGTSRLAGRLLLRMAVSRADLACVRTSPWPVTRPSTVRSKPQPPPKEAPKGEWDLLFPSGN